MRANLAAPLARRSAEYQIASDGQSRLVTRSWSTRAAPDGGAGRRSVPSGAVRWTISAELLASQPRHRRRDRDCDRRALRLADRPLGRPSPTVDRRSGSVCRGRQRGRSTSVRLWTGPTVSAPPSRRRPRRRRRSQPEQRRSATPWRSSRPDARRDWTSDFPTTGPTPDALPPSTPGSRRAVRRAVGRGNLELTVTTARWRSRRPARSSRSGREASAATGSGRAMVPGAGRRRHPASGPDLALGLTRNPWTTSTATTSSSTTGGPITSGSSRSRRATYEGANPLCGDRITMQLGVRDGVVERRRVHGARLRDQPGGASLLTDEIKGKPRRRRRGHPRRRPPRAARHRHQPGAPEVRAAHPRDAAAARSPTRRQRRAEAPRGVRTAARDRRPPSRLPRGLSPAGLTPASLASPAPTPPRRPTAPVDPPEPPRRHAEELRRPPQGGRPHP